MIKPAAYCRNGHNRSDIIRVAETIAAGNISAAWSVYIADGNEVVESRLASEGAYRPREVSAAWLGF